MTYQVSLETCVDLTIMRVENGWLLRTHNNSDPGISTPLKVAETPESLIRTVSAWARAHAAKETL